MTSLRGKLAGPPRSLADMADLIEKHVGDGADESRCGEALDALRRLNRDNPGYYLRVALRGLDANGTPCERLRKVVATLRRWRFHSGIS
jgi:hypothetical protein